MLKRILSLLAVAVMTELMLVTTTGAALAALGNNGKGAANASPNASSGITTAITHSGGCTFSC